MLKIAALILAALLFWIRYHYCHHPIINPEKPAAEMRIEQVDGDDSGDAAEDTAPSGARP